VNEKKKYEPERSTRFGRKRRQEQRHAAYEVQPSQHFLRGKEPVGDHPEEEGGDDRTEGPTAYAQ